MGSLIYLAAAIPFVIIVAGVAALATVRYTIHGERLMTTILGIPVIKIPLSHIESIEYMPQESVKRFSLFHHEGVVVVRLTGDREKALALSPRDPESFSLDLKEQVLRLTGRRV